MSLTYALYMDSDIDPETALAVVASSGASDHEEVSARSLTDPLRAFHPSGMLVRASREPSDPDDEHDEAERAARRSVYGFEPTVSVRVDLRSSLLFEEQKDALARGIMEILSRYEGDAIALCNEERPWLRRLGNDLVLSSEVGEWPASRLEFVPLPYRIGDLPLL